MAAQMAVFSIYWHNICALPPYLTRLCAPFRLLFIRASPFLTLPGGCPMLHFDLQLQQFVGDSGVLQVPDGDEVSRKLAMLLEGQCQGLGPLGAAQKFGFSKQRYFQLRRLLTDADRKSVV